MLALALATLAAAAPAPVTLAYRERYSRDGDVTSTRLVAHDRRGRRFVLARARNVERADFSRRGSVLGGSWASGRRVVWVKARIGRRWTVTRLHVARVGSRVRRLETLWLSRTRTGRGLPPLDAVITTRGELAWLTSRAVMTRRPGRRPRAIARRAYDGVALEDDRTLRLDDVDGFAYADLRPPPRGTPACRGRERFRPVFESPVVIVTEAAYGSRESPDLSLRVCRRANGRDPVVASAYEAFPDGTDFFVAGADRDWVLFVETFCGREGCTHRVRTAQAGSGRRGPGRTFSAIGLPSDRPWQPREPGMPMAVNDDGIPAWVTEVDGVARLVAIPRRGSYRLLDSGAPGSLRDLAFDGSVLTWTHDGEPRSADLTPA